MTLSYASRLRCCEDPPKPLIIEVLGRRITSNGLIAITMVDNRCNYDASTQSLNSDSDGDSVANGLSIPTNDVAVVAVTAPTPSYAGDTLDGTQQQQLSHEEAQADELQRPPEAHHLRLACLACGANVQ